MEIPFPGARGRRIGIGVARSHLPDNDVPSHVLWPSRWRVVKSGSGIISWGASRSSSHSKQVVVETPISGIVQSAVVLGYINDYPIRTVSFILVLCYLRASPSSILWHLYAATPQYGEH